jgi:hypothetical protein
MHGLSREEVTRNASVSRDDFHHARSHFLAVLHDFPLVNDPPHRSSNNRDVVATLPSHEQSPCRFNAFVCMSVNDPYRVFLVQADGEVLLKPLALGEVSPTGREAATETVMANR